MNATQDNSSGGSLDDKQQDNATATADALADADFDGDDFDALGFARSSQYRRFVIAVLRDQVTGRTPSQIAEHSAVERSIVSRAIQELRDEDVVELLVDESRRKGRLYALTTRGEWIAAQLEGEDA